MKKKKAKHDAEREDKNTKAMEEKNEKSLDKKKKKNAKSVEQTSAASGVANGVAAAAGMPVKTCKSKKHELLGEIENPILQSMFCGGPDMAIEQEKPACGCQCPKTGRACCQAPEKQPAAPAPAPVETPKPAEPAPEPKKEEPKPEEPKSEVPPPPPGVSISPEPIPSVTADKPAEKPADKPAEKPADKPVPVSKAQTDADSNMAHDAHDGLVFKLF